MGGKTASRPSRRQTALLLAALVAVASAVTAASFLVKPSRARAFDLFYGTIFLDDDRAPVAVDLASGEPTIRLVDAITQVSTEDSGQLQVVPLQGGTLLLNTATGEFNMVDGTGFVIKNKGGGVPLPPQSGPTRSTGIASGSMAYIVQVAASHTGVYLVSQSTVDSATGQEANVKPRAFTTMNQPGSVDPGANASANSALWMLVGSGTSRTIRELTLPEGSNAGARLGQHDHGRVSGAAAIGVAELNSAGEQAVGVADADALRVFGPSGRSATLAVPGLNGVDRVLPATNQRGRLSFLYHSAAGWSLVEANADGSGSVSVHALPEIGAATPLAEPAASRGALYTMETGTSGRIWRISGSGEVSAVPNAPSYPVARSASGAHVEAATFGNAYTIARGARVIFNSPSHVKALTVFTDGSHPPVVIDKSAAIDLNASGGAAEITAQHRSQTPNKEPTEPTPTADPKPVQPVNNHIDCTTASQVPHIPTVQLVERGSRSVQLRWSYPLLDPQDCMPSTYTVSVERLSADGPAAPGTVTVQGQNGVNLTGLFPNTEYQIVVTAYINKVGTPSAPLKVRTSVEGPAAPTNVHTRVDDNGNWTITWNSCGGRDESCVPSANWTIIPAFCDGRGLSSPPQSVTIIGDPTQHRFSYTYQGNAGLLGRGLSFQVEGVGTTGVIGTPAKDNQCSYSWSHPNAAAMSLTGGLTSDRVADGATTSATVTLHFDGNRAAATGGTGAQFTYQLLAGGDVVQTKDPTTATTATFSGIKPGRDYSAQVSVAPAKHSDAAVTVGPVSVGNAISSWPALSVSASFANTDDLSGTLTVAIDGVSSATSRGESFSLADSKLMCGSSGYALTKSGFDPAAGPLSFPGINRSDFNGNCKVSVHLQETQQSGPLFYGGAESPGASDTVTIQPPTLDVSFQADWDDSSPNTVDVTYAGRSISSGQQWALTLYSPDGRKCGSTTPSDIQPPTVTNTECLNSSPTGTWQVSVTFTYFGTSEHPPKVDVGGSQTWPTVTASNFKATWAGKSGNQYQLQLTYRGPANLGPADWSEVVTNPANGPDNSCGHATWNPSESKTKNILVATNCTQFSDVPVTVTITNDANRDQTPIRVQAPRPNPTNVTCAPQEAQFSAEWAGTHDEPRVEVDVDAGQAKLGGCSDWTLTLEYRGLLDSHSCGTAPGPSGTITPDCALAGKTGWTVSIEYTDNTESGTPTAELPPITVDGSPP